MPTPPDRPGTLLLVDLDGVLYRGSAPVPGVAALLARRAAAGDDVVYVTNNSMWYRAEYVERIAGMGAPVDVDRIVSSPRATALYLVDHEPGVRHVLTVGASGLDPQLTYRRLAVAADCVRAGARFIATNRDPVYPTERAIRPGAGAVVAALEAASGVTPISIGKPERYLLEEAARAVGRDAREAIMIGDGLTTDIAAARAVGARSVLMLTGVSTRALLGALPATERPTDVAADASAF